MYNHYQGNSGRVRRVDDGTALPARQPREPEGQSPAMQVQGHNQFQSQPQQRSSKMQQTAPNTQRPAPRPVSAPGPVSKRPPSPLTGLSGELGRLLNRLSPMNLETDDLILAMILYLMYRESHDEELLYIMAAMFLL